jgi:MFS family permease
MIWSAGAISDVGTWVQLIIVGSLIARTTGSALLTGLTAVATFTPQGVFSPLGGMLADRMDRRRLFGVALAGQAMATTVLAVLLSKGVHSPYALAAVIFFQSSFGAFGNPSYQAMAPDLVPPEEIPAMVGLTIASWNAGRILGPILATVLDRTVGAPTAIVANALTFAAMSVAVLSLRRPFPPSAKHNGDSMVRQLKVGGRALFNTPGCWVAVQAVIALNFIVAPFIGLMPIYARSVFHGGTGMAGLFSTVQGIGALTGALTLTHMVHQYGRYHTLLAGITALLSVYLIYAWAPRAIVAVAMLPIMGFGSSVFFASVMSMIQRDAPSHQRGRVMSLMQSATGVTYGMGVILFGQLGDVYGLRKALSIAALFGITVTVFALLRYRHWRAIIDIAGAKDKDLATWQLMPEF